ncbi:MAG: L-seryl-tRNA(Sec) selenium transferase [Deltaproteobacteria bacterium]|nr:L-seryl-tRNA(Sec) selenium transferase [Deltaproteobacteria bacterium]
MDPARAHLLRQLPQVDELLRHPALLPAVTPLPRALAAAQVRRTLADIRERLANAPLAQLPLELDQEDLLQQILKALQAAAYPSIRRVINATGVVIHTNLGRSPLAAAALAQIQEVGACYSTLEYDLAKGERGSRHDHLEGLLKEITDCEAALVLNNNAGAVLLALTALAQGKEVIISRGQLVEIGGSFRLPEIMAVSGARMREVGATNKTHLRDYEQAIGDETAVLLKVHPSNFRITGFTSEVSLPDLVALGRRYNLLVVEDLGSGCLVDLSRYGIEREPTVQETIKAGADLVLFSGDKLLGGPQAGLALGSREVVSRLRRHPLTRALRPDKLTLAGLEATLRLYLDEPGPMEAIPTLRMLSRPLNELDRQAKALARSLRRALGEGIQVRVVDSIGRVGGGALPQVSLPSRALALTAPPLSPQQLEARLRQADPPVIARIEQDQLLLDMRTLPPDDLPVLKAALQVVLG